MVNEKTILTEQAELSNCNFVKTILMLLVVIYHCILYWGGKWFVGSPVFSAPALSIFAEWLNSFHIYAFTLVSGYLFYYLKCEKGKYGRFLPFVANKSKRLLIPYVFVSMVWVIPFAAYFFRYTPWDIMLKFGLGTAPNQLWFLLMLFGLFVMFYPLTAIFQKHNIGGAAIALAFYGIGLLGSAVLPNVFQVFSSCTYLPMFWLGFKLRQYGSQQLRKIPSVVWIVADVSLFILMRKLTEFDGLFFTLLRQGLRFLLHVIGSLMAFVVLQKIADHVKWAKSKVFGILSKNSMPLYLLHQQVIYVFISLLNGVVNPYIHAGVNFIGAMAISLLIAALLMKFKWTKYLIGEK